MATAAEQMVALTKAWYDAYREFIFAVPDDLDDQFTAEQFTKLSGLELEEGETPQQAIARVGKQSQDRVPLWEDLYPNEKDLLMALVGGMAEEVDAVLVTIFLVRSMGIDTREVLDAQAN